MISIITAVHNQLAMNRIFWHYLSKYTKNPFELIIIDNDSSDGSREFFASIGAKIIANPGNYSYPYCQNQGISLATYENIAFLNNDIIVSPNWDQTLLSSMEFNHLDVATSCGIEQIENAESTRQLKNRWKAIKNILSILGINRWNLLLMHKLMYPNWERFCAARYKQFKLQIKEGFVGNTVIMKKSALAKIGTFDPRIQGADFDLYLRTKQRSLEHHDMQPMAVCLDVFNHHYIRLTLKTNNLLKNRPPKFVDQDNLISLADKWDAKYLQYLDALNR